MGYEMQWISGPAPQDDPDQFAIRSRFQATERTMAALCREMEQQGMLGVEGIAAVKLERGAGDVVTRQELEVALLRASSDPSPPDDEMSMALWSVRWAAWLDFLVGALKCGGFRITRASLH